MISSALAVAAAGEVRPERAEYARDARLFRALALILDAVTLAALSFVVNSVYGVTQITSGLPLFYSTSTTVAWPWLTLLGILYFLVPEALFGASPGKYWAGLRVVRIDGSPLDIRAVVIRNLLKPIDFLPAFYLLGGVSVLMTKLSQRLGDFAAGTTVVYRHRALEAGATRGAGPRARRIFGALLVVAVLFTIAFNYFGRPPLVIEGLFNTGQLSGAGATAYTLGNPQWGFGTVTYRFSTRGVTPANACEGTITLQWFVAGWTAGRSGYSCLR